MYTDTSTVARMDVHGVVTSQCHNIAHERPAALRQFLLSAVAVTFCSAAEDEKEVGIEEARLD